MTSHADNHDKDKLGRWSGDLRAEDTGKFPVCAVFLTTADDRASHDVFRKFRASFESRGAGFQHIVIFGQHGRSSTVNALLGELGLPEDSVPLVALFPAVGPTRFYTLALPAGSADGSPEIGASTIREGVNAPLWQAVLTGLESAIDGGDGAQKLASLPDLTGHEFAGGSLEKLVNRLISSL